MEIEWIDLRGSIIILLWKQIEINVVGRSMSRDLSFGGRNVPPLSRAEKGEMLHR